MDKTTLDFHDRLWLTELVRKEMARCRQEWWHWKWRADEAEASPDGFGYGSARSLMATYKSNMWWLGQIRTKLRKMEPPMKRQGGRK